MNCGRAFRESFTRFGACLRTTVAGVTFVLALVLPLPNRSVAENLRRGSPRSAMAARRIRTMAAPRKNSARNSIARSDTRVGSAATGANSFCSIPRRRMPGP